MVTKKVVQEQQQMQAIVVNSGVANSCTGVQGMEDAQTMQAWTAEKLKIHPELVGVASTGVIGELLPMDTLKNGLSKIVVNGNADDFAKAILTTDTATKTCVIKEDFGTDEVTMAGVAKGSGMIHPNMATMLGFITCDAVISSATLQMALSQNVEKTFNQITVDGDTSTNDMVLVLSNGCTKNKEILPDTPEFDKFVAMLQYVMEDLAKKIAKDGEGATKLIEVQVQQAPDALGARMILAAVGYAGVEFSPENVDIFLGHLPVMLDSSPVAFDEEEMADIMAQEEIVITVDLHDGQASGRAWGCDLSYDYVKINALYRT